MTQSTISQQNSSIGIPSQHGAAPLGEMRQPEGLDQTCIDLCKGLEFAFVQSCWHRDIVDAGRDAFVAEMAAGAVSRDAIELFEVPGALEIPLLSKKLAKTGRYAAIIACGLVVDGGIYRHEFVAAAVINALMSVQLDTEVPVISAVLTPHHFHDHDEHRRFFRAHFVVKGQEAARACLQTVSGLRGADLRRAA